MSQTVLGRVCRVCNGLGERFISRCYRCNGKGRMPPPKRKLDSLTTPGDFIILAVDHAIEAGLDATLPPDLVNDQGNCAYMVGATKIIRKLVKYLPHTIIRLDTQSARRWYWRPVFRKEILLHALNVLFPGQDVEYHLRTLNVRYIRTELRRRNYGSDRPTAVSKQDRKRWRIDPLPEGEQLT